MPSEQVLDTADSILAAILEVRDARGWTLTQLPDKLIWQFDVAGTARSYRCYLQIEPDDGLVVVYGIVPTVVAEEERVAAAVALTAINHGLAVGKFELDLRDGEVRFSTGVDVSRTRLDATLFANLVDGAIRMLDAYAPQLMARPFPALPNAG